MINDDYHGTDPKTEDDIVRMYISNADKREDINFNLGQDDSTINRLGSVHVR